MYDSIEVAAGVWVESAPDAAAEEQLRRVPILYTIKNEADHQVIGTFTGESDEGVACEIEEAHSGSNITFSGRSGRFPACGLATTAAVPEADMNRLMLYASFAGNATCARSSASKPF